MIIDRLDDIAHRYDAVFCDLWGCLHNGVRPFPDAVAALEQFRDGGGIVLLLTNSPRPAASVMDQLDGIGVDRALYSSVASSGDAAQAALAAGMFGRRVYHLGPERDTGFFDSLSENEGYDGIEIERVPLDEAEHIVCTGLFDDETETPDDYRETFLYAANEDMKLLCANPDVVVDRGDKRIFCAGALAQAYTEAGGESHYFGKPHAPIYQLARRRLEEAAGRPIADDRILCIGDGITTDIRGGVGEGLDTLFITGGLARQATGTEDQPDADALRAFLADAKLSPTASIGFLR
ncbi:MAG: TIGR01459 family HAD-type hydrolase [Pseudomonadota bacterium]